MFLFSQTLQHTFVYRHGFNPFLVNKSLKRMTKSRCITMEGERGLTWSASLTWSLFHTEVQESDGVMCVTFVPL